MELMGRTSNRLNSEHHIVAREPRLNDTARPYEADVGLTCLASSRQLRTISAAVDCKPTLARSMNKFGPHGKTLSNLKLGPVYPPRIGDVGPSQRADHSPFSSVMASFYHDQQM